MELFEYERERLRNWLFGFWMAQEMVEEEEMKKVPETIEVVIRSNHTPLIARIVWEQLFRAVKAEKFQHLQDFLCDLKGFEDMFMKHNSFYWSCLNCGVTDITTSEPSENCGRTVFKVQLVPHEEGRWIELIKLTCLHKETP